MNESAYAAGDARHCCFPLLFFFLGQRETRAFGEN